MSKSVEIMDAKATEFGMNRNRYGFVKLKPTMSQDKWLLMKARQLEEEKIHYSSPLRVLRQPKTKDVVQKSGVARTYYKKKSKKKRQKADKYKFSKISYEAPVGKYVTPSLNGVASWSINSIWDDSPFRNTDWKHRLWANYFADLKLHDLQKPDKDWKRFGGVRNIYRIVIAEIVTFTNTKTGERCKDRFYYEHVCNSPIDFVVAISEIVLRASNRYAGNIPQLDNRQYAAKMKVRVLGITTSGDLRWFNGTIFHFMTRIGCRLQFNCDGTLSTVDGFPIVVFDPNAPAWEG